MLNTISVPDNFMKYALLEGIPSDLARKLYITRMAKKSTEHLVYNLVNAKAFPHDGAARKAIRTTWINFNKELQNTNDLDKNLVETYKKVVPSDYLDQARRELESLIGKFAYPKYQPVLSKETDRVAVASDFHHPFADENAIIQLGNDNAKKLVIVGDWCDMYAASKYRSTITHITVKEELAIARSWLEYLASKFETINILRSGNHDQRAIRRLQEFFPQLAVLMSHPIDVLSFGLKNVNVVSQVVDNTADNTKFGENMDVDFMAQDGDALYGHFENFCGSDAPKKLEGWLGEWDHILKLDTQPRAIFQAHTHRLSLEITPKGKILVGTGCMCKPMPYQIEGHGKYSPPTLGYVAIYQNKGLTDIKRTQLIPL